MGDIVRTPRGRVTWTVTRLAPAYGTSKGKVLASLRSENGSRNRLLTDDLVLIEAASSPAPSWEELRDGTIYRDGQLVRCTDGLIHTAIEWRWPRYGDPDPYDDVEPRGVIASVCKADDDGERRVRIELIGALDRNGCVSLGREAVLELGAALLGMGNKVGPNYTPGA